MTDDDPKDPKVKDLVERDRSQPLEELVDPATAAQLERWFGLPSFAQVEAGEVKLVEDPEVVAIRERRQRLAEEIDPAFLAALDKRYTLPEGTFKFVPEIEPFNTRMALFDATRYLVEGDVLPEERTYDTPEDIYDALKENAPQALLRDLHRPETDFDQPVDEFWQEEEQEAPPPLVMDIAARTREAINFRFEFQPFEPIDASRLREDFLSEVRAPWPEVLTRARLVNRRVSE